MGRILEMDDINKGMFLTVLRGKITKKTIPGPLGPILGFKEDKKFNGKVLKVVAIDMPFIAVEFFFRSGWDMTKKDTLDIRDLILGTLSSEYISVAEPRWKAPTIPTFAEEPDWDYKEWKQRPVYQKE